MVDRHLISTVREIHLDVLQHTLTHADIYTLSLASTLSDYFLGSCFVLCSYIRFLLPGIPFAFFYELLRKLLQAQSIVNPMLAVAVFGNVINVIGTLLPPWPHKERERETERDTDRERYRQIEIQTERERETDRQTDREGGRETPQKATGRREGDTERRSENFCSAFITSRFCIPHFLCFYFASCFRVVSCISSMLRLCLCLQFGLPGQRDCKVDLLPVLPRHAALLCAVQATSHNILDRLVKKG